MLPGNASRRSPAQSPGVLIDSDAELAVRVRRGDADAFRALFLRYHDILWRFAYRVVRSRESADDVVQDVFLAVWELGERWVLDSADDAVRHYLFAAVRHRAVRVLRQEMRTEPISRIGTSDGEIQTPVASMHGESQPPTDEAVDHRDCMIAVGQAIEAMPPLRQQVVRLRWMHGLSYDEIGRVLGIRPEAAMKHVSRARETIRPIHERFLL